MYTRGRRPKNRLRLHTLVMTEVSPFADVPVPLVADMPNAPVTLLLILSVMTMVCWRVSICWRVPPVAKSDATDFFRKSIGISRPLTNTGL